jgi:hypothetical protein
LNGYANHEIFKVFPHHDESWMQLCAKDFARHRTEAIATLQSEKARLREVLKRIANRDGCASDHISCHDCYDSSQEANAALKDTPHD